MTKKYEVLMVDDQHWWYEALTPILEELDCSVNFADTAHAAEIALETHVYDLLILDLRLEEDKEYDVQGLDILEKLITLKNAPPAIVLSGHVTPALRQKTTRLKAFALLEKTGDEMVHSFDRALFIQTVKEALGQN